MVISVDAKELTLRDFLTLVVLPKITKTDRDVCLGCLIQKALRPFSPYPYDDSPKKYLSAKDFDVFLQNSDATKDELVQNFPFIVENFGVKSGADEKGTYIYFMDRGCMFTKSETGSLFDGLLTAKRHRCGVDSFTYDCCENCESEVTLLRNSLLITKTDFPEHIVPLVWAIVTPDEKWEDITQTAGFRYNEDEIPNETQTTWNQRVKDILLRYEGHFVVSVGCIYDPNILNNYGTITNQTT